MTADEPLTGEVLPPGLTPEKVTEYQEDPRSYKSALERRAQTDKTHRRPRVGDPPVTMIFKAMGLIDENGEDTE